MAIGQTWLAATSCFAGSSSWPSPNTYNVAQYYIFFTFWLLQAGKYVWKTYGEVYEAVLCIGSAMRHLGVGPVSFYLYY
jgi:hypothetical protein